MGVLIAATLLALASNPNCGGNQGVEPERLKAVALKESGGNFLAIRDDSTGKDVSVPDVTAAIVTATRLIAAGHVLDLGLMQISSPNLTRDGLTIETAFDACANMKAGAHHLAADHDWVLAHRRYNCGKTDCSQGYADSIDMRIDHTTLSAALPKSSDLWENANSEIWSEESKPDTETHTDKKEVVMLSQEIPR